MLVLRLRFDSRVVVRDRLRHWCVSLESRLLAIPMRLRGRPSPQEESEKYYKDDAAYTADNTPHDCTNLRVMGCWIRSWLADAGTVRRGLG
jgi:hypothetical protein